MSIVFIFLLIFQSYFHLKQYYFYHHMKIHKINFYKIKLLRNILTAVAIKLVCINSEICTRGTYKMTIIYSRGRLSVAP